MPKITEEPLEAVQIRLFKTDLDYLRGLFKGTPDFSVNEFVRSAVRAHVKLVQAKAAEAIDEAERDAPEIVI